MAARLGQPHVQVYLVLIEVDQRKVVRVQLLQLLQAKIGVSDLDLGQSQVPPGVMHKEWVLLFFSENVY